MICSTNLLSKIFGKRKTNKKENETNQFTLEKLEIKSRKKTTVFDCTDLNTNYYRATNIFGDIASKKIQYPDQIFTPSFLKVITQSTPEVEKVRIKVDSTIANNTDRDLQAYDIAAKAAGVGGFKEMNGTEAYDFFLQVNSDDFTARETEYKGKTETKHYFDSEKSDGKITLFSSEIVDGKEYLAMHDKKGKVHYFDMQDGLKEKSFTNAK
ncbi:hypothetical protein IJ384_05585 [bacterium]|nr:hypothetical protein [bacterium]